MLTDSTAALSIDADYARDLGLGPLVDLIEARGLEVGHVDARPINLIDDRGRICSRGLQVRLEVDGDIIIKVDGFNDSNITGMWWKGGTPNPATKEMLSAIRAGWANGGIQRAIAAI